MSEDVKPIRRALISVSDKTGVADFAARLAALGVEILSTGGTAATLVSAGVDVIEVGDHTGAPEIMGGRVKTLHPRIHGGILGRRGIDDTVMDDHDIPPIDLVVVNLYPFEQTIARADCDEATAIETIDIGGPAMLRAAAKNHADVTLVVEPRDFDIVADELEAHGGVAAATRRRLAAAGFAHTAGYDRAIADYLQSVDSNGEAGPTDARFSPLYTDGQPLRYGENPHQRAFVYRHGQTDTASIVNARLCQGKALSYNNYADADAALACVRALGQAPACVIVKHANPCGVAVADDLETAYQRAFATDPVSAFGGVIAFNRRVDADTANAIVGQQFAEVILAPVFDDAALGAFSRKKNLRVLAVGALADDTDQTWQIRSIAGGALVQQADHADVDLNALQVVSQRAPTETQKQDLFFAWKVAKYVKSNAIVYARDGRTLGIGAGQMSRVDSARIAAQKAADAELDLSGCVLASDAFFPFRDGLETAAAVGVAAVIQPGGSKRDDEVIAAANEANIAMLFTGIRHFRH